LFLKEFL